MARPKKEITKSKRVEFRTTENGLNKLDGISKKLECTRTETINLALVLLDDVIEQGDNLEQFKKIVKENK